MNYYEHHIGDFDQATAHLTACEDGIYSRLLRRYYATEKPLPADVGAVQRLVRARAKDEKQAVIDMLNEFFVLRDSGWHQPRCDLEIARYCDGEPERAIRKANEDNRVKRHRDERSKLFKTLTDAGQHAPWNIGMNELRGLVEKLVTAPETTTVTQPATAPVTPATATQTPDTRHHLPDLPSEESTPSEKPEKQNGKARKRSLPNGFEISDRVRTWAERKGFDRLEAHFESFVRKCRAKDYQYVDWDEGFMGAITDDWAKLRSGKIDIQALAATLEDGV